MGRAIVSKQSGDLLTAEEINALVDDVQDLKGPADFRYHTITEIGPTPSGFSYTYQPVKVSEGIFDRMVGSPTKGVARLQVLDDDTVIETGFTTDPEAMWHSSKSPFKTTRLGDETLVFAERSSDGHPVINRVGIGLVDIADNLGSQFYLDHPNFSENTINKNAIDAISDTDVIIMYSTHQSAWSVTADSWYGNQDSHEMCLNFLRMRWNGTSFDNIGSRVVIPLEHTDFGYSSTPIKITGASLVSEASLSHVANITARDALTPNPGDYIVVDSEPQAYRWSSDVDGTMYWAPVNVYDQLQGYDGNSSVYTHPNVIKMNDNVAVAAWTSRNQIGHMVAFDLSTDLVWDGNRTDLTDLSGYGFYDTIAICKVSDTIVGYCGFGNNWDEWLFGSIDCTNATLSTLQMTNTATRDARTDYEYMCVFLGNQMILGNILRYDKGGTPVSIIEAQGWETVADLATRDSNTVGGNYSDGSMVYVTETDLGYYYDDPSFTGDNDVARWKEDYPSGTYRDEEGFIGFELLEDNTFKYLGEVVVFDHASNKENDDVTMNIVDEDRIMFTHYSLKNGVWGYVLRAKEVISSADVIHRQDTLEAAMVQYRTYTIAGTVTNLTGAAAWYAPNTVTLTKIEAWLGTAGGQVDVDVLSNGSSIGTVTIASGELIAPPLALSQKLLSTDRITVDVTSTSGQDLVVRLTYT